MIDRIGMRARWALLGLATGVGLTAGAVIVSAQIPDATGTIHACIAQDTARWSSRNTPSGANVRVVEDPGECRSGETPLNWMANGLPSDGKAADADLLDGMDSTAFVAGGGSVARQVADIAPGNSASFSTGLSTITVNCPSNLADPGSVQYRSNAPGLARTWIETSTGQSFFRVGTADVSVATAAGGGHVTIASVHQLQPNRTVLAEVFIAHDTTLNLCVVYAHLTQN